MDKYQRKIKKGDPVITTDGKIMYWQTTLPSGGNNDGLYTTSSYLSSRREGCLDPVLADDSTWFRIDPETSAYKRLTNDNDYVARFKIGDEVTVIDGIYIGRVGVVEGININRLNRTHSYHIVMQSPKNGPFFVDLDYWCLEAR